MRKTTRSGGFLLCLFLNILLNLEGAIPALLLLVLHFVLGWSVWWAVLALGLWILGIALWKHIIGWARNCGNEPSPPQENKNPYSVGNRPKK